jgi:hypothetical protein
VELIGEVMPSGLRSRSVSRSRVVKTSELFESGEALDPLVLLADILPKLNDLDIPLGVTLSDNQKSVTYLLSVFTEKEYEVIVDEVKFGLKRLKIRELKVEIKFNVQIVDDTEIVE